MKYQFTVIQGGSVLFATDPDQVMSKDKVRELASVLAKRFPTREGFRVAVSIDPCEHDHYETVNEFMRAHFPGPHYGF